MGTETFITDMREALKAFTEADPYFSDVVIVTERTRDLQSRINQTLAKINGICIVLITPTVGGVLANVPGANFSDIRFVARVLEAPTINATGKAAQDVATRVVQLWSQARPDTFPSALRPDEPVMTIGNDPKFAAWDVSFVTEGGYALEIPTLAAIAADTADLGAIALTHATPGAAIFRTLDGTRPIPRNPAAALVNGTFSGTAGQTLRAQAFLAGYTASPETRTTLA